MADATPRWGLTYMVAGQTHKHVTVNEALRSIDSLANPRVLDRDLTDPPANPSEGDSYLPASPATGDWAGHEGAIVTFQDGAWAVTTPPDGTVVWVVDEKAALVRDGGAWSPFGDAAQVLAALPTGSVAQLGVATPADSANPLAVAGSGALFTHAGAGMQAKINKNATGDTASVIFQTGFAAHAEMGLSGSNNFELKVSVDGAAWTSALLVNHTNGNVLANQKMISPVVSASNRVEVQGAYVLAGRQPRLAASGGSIDPETRAALAAHGLVEADAFSPADLFSAGASGGWWDFSDPSTLWTERTDPVSTAVDGSYVGRVVDLSGNGAHLSATTDGARPRYRADNFVGLEFDGSDVLRQDALASVFSGDDKAFTVYLVLATDSMSGTSVAMGVGSSASSTPVTWFGTSNSAWSIKKTADGGGAKTQVANAGADTSAHVIALRCSGVDLDIWVDEVRTRTAASFDVGATTLDRFVVGALMKSSASAFFSGRIGEAVIVDEAHDDATVKRTLRYLLAKHFNAPLAYDLVLAAGQSNMVGQGVASQAPAVTKRSGFEVVSGVLSPIAQGAPGATGRAMWPAFANAWRDESGRGVIVVPTAAGGTALLAAADSGNGDWSPTGTLKSAAEAAWTSAKTFVETDTCLTIAQTFAAWSQGEREAQSWNGTDVTPDLYGAALEALMADWLSTLNLDAFGVVQTGRSTNAGQDADFALVQGAQTRAVAAQPHALMLFDGAKDFPDNGKMADSLHWNQAGLDEAGAASAASLVPALRTLALA